MGKKDWGAKRIMLGMEWAKKTEERICRVNHEKAEKLVGYDEDPLHGAPSIKQQTAEERREKNKLFLENAIQVEKMIWLFNKFESSQKQVERRKQIEEAMRAETEKKSKKRQRRVEYMRKMLPAKVQKQREDKKRLMEIVRKFALRWLERVRKRLSAPKDYLHESVWTGNSKSVLDHTLKYLKEISGYEKMDDFVMNIIKLKREIQRQIELEEKEEAAVAAAAIEQLEHPEAEEESIHEDDVEVEKKDTFQEEMTEEEAEKAEEKAKEADTVEDAREVGEDK